MQLLIYINRRLQLITKRINQKLQSWLTSAVPCRRLHGVLPSQNHRRELHNGSKPQWAVLGHGRRLGQRESRLQARAKQSRLHLVAQAVQTLVGR